MILLIPLSVFFVWFSLRLAGDLSQSRARRGAAALGVRFASMAEARLAWRFFEGPPGAPVVLVEAALASSMVEWWPLAERLSKRFSVLVYDRAGYGFSPASRFPRTPDQIARELLRLLEHAGIRDPIILLGHSQGGLYAQKFARMYPARVRAVVFLDPLTAEASRMREELSRAEYRGSGDDKTSMIVRGRLISMFGLGPFFGPRLRKAPPFTLHAFSPDEQAWLLAHLTRSETWRTTWGEYHGARTREVRDELLPTLGFPNLPIRILFHAEASLPSGSGKGGSITREQAEKVEAIRERMARRLLTLGNDARFVRLKRSNEYLHLQDPDLVESTLLEAASRGH